VKLPVVGRGLVVLSVGVSSLGVAWLGVRSHSVNDLFEELRSLDADVLIARNAFLLREGGRAIVGQHWLSTDGDAAYAAAVDVAAQSGAHRVAVVFTDREVPASSVPPGWQEVDRSIGDLAGDRLLLVTFELPEANMRSHAGPAG
jgi:hypothetical protein